VANLDKHMMDVVRCDTGVVVSSRAMTQAEESAARQGSLGLDRTVELGMAAHRAERAADAELDRKVEALAARLEGDPVAQQIASDFLDKVEAEKSASTKRSRKARA
jgi:hypothetical protein